MSALDGLTAAVTELASVTGETELTPMIRNVLAQLTQAQVHLNNGKEQEAHLNQQLAESENLRAEIERLLKLNSAVCEKGNRQIIENARLSEQLAAAIAACKLKDEALNNIALGCYPSGICQQARDALAIQPDDAALAKWLGKPIARMLKYVGTNDYALSQEPIARAYDELPDGMYSDTWEKVDELYSQKGLK